MIPLVRYQEPRRPGVFRVLWQAFAVCLGLISIGCPAAAAVDSKLVMILHSFGRDFKPWSEYAKSIRTELERQSPWPIELFDHSLTALRPGDDAVEAAFAQYLQALFGGRPPDLIVSVGAPAAAFVQRHRKEFWADVPMILTAIDQRRVQFSKLTDNDTAVPVRIDHLAALQNIINVLPNTENVVVVIGASPIEKFWKGAYVQETESLAGRLKISWTDHLSFDALLQTATKLPPRTAIYWGLMVVDAAGVVYEGNTEIARLYAAANAPIFSYDESFFGEGVVGGPFLHVSDTSRQTAAVAVRILGGEKAGDIEILPVQFARPVFDWRQLQRWNISESLLPTGSEIRFRQPAAWDQYRWQIIAIALAVLLQAGMIHRLLRERRQRRLSEVMARNMLAELSHMNRLATGNELSASIAHEVMQPLTGMVSSANAGLRWLSSSTPDVDKARAMLSQVVAAGHRAAEVVRAVRAIFKRETNETQSVAINGLIVIVLDLIQYDLQRDGVETQIRLEENLPAIDADPVQIQQVLLNLMLNAVDAMRSLPPGQERVLCVRSGAAEGGVNVSVEDTGPGVPAEKFDEIFKPLFTTKSEGLGLGLAICRSIVDAHHGRIWAAPAQPCGLAVHVYLPIASPELAVPV